MLESISTFFLKISLERVCLQRNQQKYGGTNTALFYFSPFLQSDREEEMHITLTNNLGFKERKENMCFCLGFFFVWFGSFYFVTTCYLQKYCGMRSRAL